MVKLRFRRMGRKKVPVFSLVATDSRSPRDGRYIEDLGRFYPVSTTDELILNRERILYWLQQGAQPSDSVRNILRKEGVMLELHLIRKGAEPEEVKSQVEAHRTRWAEKAATVQTESPEEQRKKALEAERKAAAEERKRIEAERQEREAELERQRKEAEEAERAAAAEELKGEKEDADEDEAAKAEATETTESPVEEAVEEGAETEEEAPEAVPTQPAASAEEEAQDEADDEATAEAKPVDKATGEVTEKDDVAEEVAEDATAEATEADETAEPKAEPEPEAEDTKVVQAASGEAEKEEAPADEADVEAEPEQEPVAETTPEPEEEAKPDKLTDVWGIGPKYASILNDAGIQTFAALAEKSVDDLQTIITDAGSTTAGNEETWAEQASLLAKGDSKEHDALVEKLKAG